MIQELYIRNYALIDELRIDFSDQLSIITGETGAGKSILLGALELIMGKRADRDSLYNPQEKCIVEGRFDLRGHDLRSFFEENDLDFEEQSILRREIAKSGKSRAFINDTPVNLTVLKSLSHLLIDLHHQQEHTELGRSDFQLEVIDSLASHADELVAYRALYKKHRVLLEEIEMKEAAEQEALRNLDYLQFQLNELEEAGLNDAEEQEKLESELKALSHAERVKSDLVQSLEGLSESEFSVQNVLMDVLSSLRQAARYNEAVQVLLERVESAAIELEDVASELDNLGENIVFDPQRIEEIEERLNLLNRLEVKHGAANLEALIEVREELSARIAGIGHQQSNLESLKKEEAQLRKALREKGQKLSKNRLKAKEQFIKEAKALLPEVGIANGKIAVRHELQELPGPAGFDQFTFLFSANKGHEARELGKIASGGELSRVMLIIKSLIAASTALPTLIFDEIDTGISGETARKVGKVLKNLSSRHQVIAITHLPQIASLGEKHFLVYKENINGKTISRVKSLSGPERMQEIAKMLSGAKPTDAALENARELLMP